jgi:hypothetical protein
MDGRPIIERYLDDEVLERAGRELLSLVRLINNSYGEYNLQLRKNYFNIYYQGNSLAKVIPNKNGTYSASIHKKFAQGDTLKKLERYSVNKPSQSARSKCKNVSFSIRPQNLHQFFRRSNINSLSSRIRAVHNGEEITFEQVLITDNPSSDKLIIIDRQVADHVNRAQIDLLTLKRDSVDKPFHFLVIEEKLGRDSDLKGKVCIQLNSFIDRVKKYIGDYADCYEKNYRQKKQLGLFDPFDDRLPGKIEIDRNENTVEGLIVVGGYSQLAEKVLRENLCPKIKRNWPHIKVQRMRNKIRLDNESYCEEP